MTVESKALSFRCCDVRIDALSLDEAVRCVQSYGLEGRGRTVHLCNANNIALASRRPNYAAVLRRSDLNLPDGASLVLLARLVGVSGVDQRTRPRGVDVMATTVDHGRAVALRHYLFGASPETVIAVSQHLQERYPGAQIVGAESPPFRPLTAEEEDAAVTRIRAAAPHVVWVALGTPRQDEFVDGLRDRLPTTLVAVGAAFDFLGGSKPEAPRWVQRSGFEWLFRLVSEPRRLWRRYLIGNVLFFLAAARGVAAVESGEGCR